LNCPPANRWEPRLAETAVTASAVPLRVMVCDDHAVVRSGVRALLESDQEIVVVAEAGSVSDAVARAAAVDPDVVVMDVRLADGSGIQAIREIRSRRPDTKVLVLTSFADDDALFSSVMAGAAGFVLKRIDEDDLVESVRLVGRGQSLLDPAVTGGLLARVRSHQRVLKDPRLALLTAREESILEMVAAGKTNGEIGDALGLSEKTVRNSMSVILSKLEVSRRAEAAAYLVRHSAKEA
jgi:two-component system response regulator DevR